MIRISDEWKLTDEVLVSEVVTANYRTASVFTANGIDFCCGGGVSLARACAKRNLDVQLLIDELNQAVALPNDKDYRQLNNTELIDEIIKKHHDFVRQAVPVITSYLNKLCTVHGAGHPELYQIAALFAESVQALTAHMKREEQVLFPEILNGSQATNLDLYTTEHEMEGERFRQMAELTDGYTCPADGCQTYRVAFAMLSDFENDLHKHVHLENNILFPRMAAQMAATAH